MFESFKRKKTVENAARAAAVVGAMAGAPDGHAQEQQNIRLENTQVTLPAGAQPDKMTIQQEGGKTVVRIPNTKDTLAVRNEQVTIPASNEQVTLHESGERQVTTLEKKEPQVIELKDEKITVDGGKMNW
jgi:hypothetical protein